MIHKKCTKINKKFPCFTKITRKLLKYALFLKNQGFYYIFQEVVEGALKYTLIFCDIKKARYHAFFVFKQSFP